MCRIECGMVDLSFPGVGAVVVFEIIRNVREAVSGPGDENSDHQ